MITTQIELDVSPGGIAPVIHVSQYDTGSRTLQFNLIATAGDLILPTGTKAEIRGTKPDGNGFSYDALINGKTVTADVTDVSGETHHGELSLPLGNKSTVLTCDLPNQVRADQLPKVIFRQKNAAGNDVSAELRYQWDGGKWKNASTQVPVSLPSLMSGQHTLTAVCGTDTLKHTFVVFALNDKKPCVKTDDWFYVSDTAFPQDGNPVTVQVGSSAEDVHIVYSILSGEKVLESGAVERFECTPQSTVYLSGELSKWVAAYILVGEEWCLLSP